MPSNSASYSLAQPAEVSSPASTSSRGLFAPLATAFSSVTANVASYFPAAKPRRGNKLHLSSMHSIYLLSIYAIFVRDTPILTKRQDKCPLSFQSISLVI